MKSDFHDSLGNSSDEVKRAEKLLNWFKGLFSIFADTIGANKEDISISVPILVETIIEIEAERRYASVYHGIEKLPLVKEMSLFCYCLLKRKPIVANEKVKRSTRINEYFCVILLLSGLSIDMKNEKITNTEYIDFLIYMFSRGELTKDSIYLLSKTLHIFAGREGDSNGI